MIVHMQELLDRDQSLNAKCTLLDNLTQKDSHNFYALSKIFQTYKNLVLHDISITFSNYHITSNREQLHFYLKKITQINNFERILFESIYHDFKVQQAHSLSIEIESINQVSLLLKNLLTIIKYSQQETKNLIEHNSELTDFERWLISSPCCRKFSKINPQDQITLIESSQNFQKLTKEIAEKEEKNLTELEKIILNNILNTRLIKTYITYKT